MDESKDLEAANAEPSDLELAHDLRLAVMRLARRLRQEAPTGVTPTQLSAWSRIAKLEPASLATVADAEHVSTATMCRIVDSLEGAGLVERRRDAADQRSLRLAVTASGRRAIAEYRRRRDALLAREIRGLSEADRRALARAAAILGTFAESSD